MEHKASRWAQYKEEKGSYTYERWSNTYNSNVTKATKAKEIELAYMKNLGWGKAQQSIKVGTGGTRRLDIAENDLGKPPSRAVEVKAYESGTVYATNDIKREVALDAQLVSPLKWKIEWHFLGCKPSAPLRDLLDKANIPIKEIP